MSKIDTVLTDAIKEALPEFRQQDDYLLAHGASLMSEDSHEIVHIDTLLRVAEAALSAKTEAQPVASSECPICGRDVPHGHSNEDIVTWLQAQASRFVPNWSEVMAIHLRARSLASPEFIGLDDTAILNITKESNLPEWVGNVIRRAIYEANRNAERNTAPFPQQEILLVAAELGLDYAKECLAVHDQKYQRHPATEAERGLIESHVEQISAAIAASSKGSAS